MFAKYQQNKPPICLHNCSNVCTASTVSLLPGVSMLPLCYCCMMQLTSSRFISICLLTVLLLCSALLTPVNAIQQVTDCTQVRYQAYRICYQVTCPWMLMAEWCGWTAGARCWLPGCAWAGSQHTRTCSTSWLWLCMPPSTALLASHRYLAAAGRPMTVQSICLDCTCCDCDEASLLLQLLGIQAWCAQDASARLEICTCMYMVTAGTN